MNLINHESDLVMPRPATFNIVSMIQIIHMALIFKIFIFHCFFAIMGCKYVLTFEKLFIWSLIDYLVGEKTCNWVLNKISLNNNWWWLIWWIIGQETLFIRMIFVVEFNWVEVKTWLMFLFGMAISAGIRDVMFD